MSQRKPHRNRPTQATPTATAIAAPSTGLPELLGAILLTGLVLVVYWPSRSGGFIFDDDLLLTQNDLIKAPDGLRRFWFTTDPADYWPVTNTSLWLEWRLWQYSPDGYHATNLVLHIVNSLLIWLVLRRLSIPGAYLAALLFAVHPVNVESVAWIAQRKNLLAMLLGLLSTIWYLRADESERPTNRFLERGAWRWYFFSAAAFLLAMLSKGSVAVLPVLLLLIIWWRRDKITRWDIARTAPLFVIAAALTVVNIWFQSHDMNQVVRDANFVERLLGAAAAVWFYLWKALVPVNLAFIYPQWRIETSDLRWWLPLLAALAVTAVLWWQRRNTRVRAVLFAWAFYCVALLPALGFTDVSFMQYSLVADHYQHLALIAVVALAAAGVAIWHERVQGLIRDAIAAAAVIAVATLAVLTYQQCVLYGDPITLYSATLKLNPDSWMLRNNLGAALIGAGRSPEAISHLEQALRLKPEYPEAHNNLGRALAGTGQLEAAIAHYHQALAIKPDDYLTHNNLGSALAELDRPQEAIDHYRQAVAMKPDFPEFHSNLGTLLLRTEKTDEAIASFEKALQLNPDSAETHAKLAGALVKNQQLEKAAEHCEQALQLARIQGQTELAKQMEAWLNSYRSMRSRETRPPDPSPLPR